MKFMLKVASSHQKQHIIAGLDLGTVEKNIITKDFGILDVFGSAVEYNASGKGDNRMPHILYQTPNGIKVIYVLGYNDKTRWKKALGSQSGCILIDEINVADMEFVREASIRCDYLMGTLNPDDPNLPVYAEYINHSRPLDKWRDDTPEPIIAELSKQEPKPGWVHWFFSFKDNAAAAEEKIAQIINGSTPGTKLYKNKILGLRGRHTGLVFNLNETRTVVSWQWIEKRLLDPNYKGSEKLTLRILSIGVDTSYSRKSDDKIVFSCQGITSNGILIKFAFQSFNNKTIVEAGKAPLAPSDIPPLLDDFIKKWIQILSWRIDAAYIDSADQATITEIEKYKRQHGIIYSIAPSWKKMPIIDRITLEQGWMAENQNAEFIVREYCQAHIDELNVYSWQEDKQAPEDANDHTINASQYGWLPYKGMIGRK